MRGIDYDATHLVKAVKGLPLNANSYTNVTIDGRRTRIVEANKDVAMDWFAEWVAQRINAMGPYRKIIVPVPSSKTTPQSAPDFRTALIARRAAARCVNTLPFPSLRFASERANSREEGGTRSAPTLYEALQLVAKIPAGRLILLDDVLTGGGHLKAAVWEIEDAGGNVAEAFCCGRSLEVQLDNPFDVPSETIDTRRA